MRIAGPHERVMLISGQGKRYYVTLLPGDRFHTNKGAVEHDALIGQPFGHMVHSHLGHPFVMLRPTLYDELMSLKRISQIIYPKELGMILLKLDARCGRRIVEAGTGSGALTMALANAVMPHGRVYSFDTRADMLRNAQQNLEAVGLAEYVELVQRDITEGFDVQDADALFLDVREPWEYLPQACAALADGGLFGALVPTTNQITALLYELERAPFFHAEVLEIMLREYKAVPGRLRPQDIMVGHTGYLVFAVKIGAEVAAARVEVAEAAVPEDESPILATDEAD